MKLVGEGTYGKVYKAQVKSAAAFQPAAQSQSESGSACDIADLKKEPESNQTEK